MPLNDSTTNFMPPVSSMDDDMDDDKQQAQQPKKVLEKKKIWIWIGLSLALLIAAGVAIGVIVAKTMANHTETIAANNGALPAAAAPDTAANVANAPPSDTAGSMHAFGNIPTETTDEDPEPIVMVCTAPQDVPKEVKGTQMDQSTWLTMEGFNCTFTNETVGDLPILGLNSTWSDKAQANPNVPALNKPWGTYGASQPIHGVNLGGWFSLEPFITPSLFDYPRELKIIDEWTLCAHLGPQQAATVLEKHYATFITEEDIKNVAAAGLDHVRIPYSYWAVETYDNDPYVPRISWRYLLRALEWCRKYGLRVKLDLHALPGSQNGWNHSGRSGKINWVLGTDQTGTPPNQNRDRSLKLHDRLSKFFAQPRYQNLVAFYGLANEPALAIPMGDLTAWTSEVFDLVTKNGITAPKVFSESMKGLPAWGGQLPGHGDKLVLDVHEYIIFDDHLLANTHAEKINFACGFMAKDVGSSPFGPTMVGEWSQADTDCTLHLNGVFNGARWNGTFFNTGTHCPTGDSRCDCSVDSADPATYTADYKLFLQTWAEAQMSAFSNSFGYFYWTWKTESAPLWSYEAAWKGGFMPKLAYQPNWKCGDPIPSFGSLPETY